MATDAQDLRDRALAVADAATAPPSFDRLRQILNDVGIHGARKRLHEAPDVVANARLAVREAQERQKAAQAAYDEAVVEAEWELASYFEVRSNKTWLTANSGGEPLPEAIQRSYTADEKKAWIQHHAAKTETVHRMIAPLSAADRDLARARDDLAVAEMAFTAAKHGLDACAAELKFLAISIPT